MTPPCGGVKRRRILATVSLARTEWTMRGSACAMASRTCASNISTCPSCGMVLVPEELATGKMLEVEKILEDK